MTRQVQAVALLIGLGFAKPSACRAQDIKVDVVDSKTSKPVADIRVALYRDCMGSKHSKAIEQRTDQAGASVFQGLSLADGPICIVLLTATYQPLDLDAMFASPDDAKRLNPDRKLLNPIVTSLPAEVTFHVRRRTIGEQLHFLFIGG